MKGDQLPESNHITRFCKGTQVNEDGTVSPAAFELRPNEEYLSINWLENLKLSDRSSEINELRSVLQKKLTFGKNAKLTVLNVGEVFKNVFQKSGDRRKLRFLHEPEPDDPSHSGIYDTKVDEILISQLIVECIIETYSAKL